MGVPVDRSQGKAGDSGGERATGTLETANIHGMSRERGASGQPEGWCGEDAKMQGVVRHVRFPKCDSGLQCPQDLAMARSSLTLVRAAGGGWSWAGRVIEVRT